MNSLRHLAPIALFSLLAFGVFRVEVFAQESTEAADTTSATAETAPGDAAAPETTEKPAANATEAKPTGEVYGPPNPLKTFPNPFATASSVEAAPEEAPTGLTLPPGTTRTRLSLAQRLVPLRVYLPGKMVIGKSADFVVKGRPGSHVAIAMADKDSGAKPILGRLLRLGPDRKVVGVGTIPESGVLTLTIDMPIQGDLIGLPVFFETAIWQKADFSDLEIASPVKSETVEEIADKPNGILVSEDKTEQKKGIRFVPDSGVPLHQRGNVSLESGRP